MELPGEQYLPSGLTSLLFSSVPFWVILIEYIAFRRRLTSRIIIGLAAGFGGLIVLILPYVWNITMGYSISSYGVLALLAGSLSWACGSSYITHKHNNNNNNAHSYRAAARYSTLTTGMQMLIGGILIISVGIATGELNALNISKISSQSSIATLYMILIGSLAGFTIFVWLINATSAFLANSFTFVSPLLAIFL